MPTMSKREFKNSKKYLDKQFKKQKKYEERNRGNARFKKRKMEEEETNDYLTQETK